MVAVSPFHRGSGFVAVACVLVVALAIGTLLLVVLLLIVDAAAG